MKTVIILIADMLCVFFAFSLAWLFHINFDIALIFPSSHAVNIGLVSLACYITAFFLFSIPKVIWRYVSIKELTQLSSSVIIGLALTLIITSAFFQLTALIAQMLCLQAVFYSVSLLISRCIYRIISENKSQSTSLKRVLIIGSGRAGELLIRDIGSHSSTTHYLPVALLDDDKNLHGRSVHGIKVLGGVNQLSSFVQSLCIDLVIVAIPSSNDRYFINKIVDDCSALACDVRILPGLDNLVDGKVSVDSLRKVDIEDLLGRKAIAIDNPKLAATLKQKTIWVTGGGGSIGSELTRQIAANSPCHLVVLDNNEYNLYLIGMEIKLSYPSLNFTSLLVNIADAIELESVFKRYHPDIIFHAAAYKHVPLLEDQVNPAIKNNVLSTQLLCDYADHYQVESFILVSSDKAVNPTNLMGMTKRLAEIYTQNINQSSNTRFSTVRFGNVLGSTGSVLPLFRKQLQSGGPLTVTDEKMTRYFMMIPEAASLILQSYLLGDGGDIFVLDMGEPINIKTLAEKLIRLSGKKPYQDIDIKIVGIRPGEKLYEELFYHSENLHKTNHQKIFKAHVRQYDWEQVKSIFSSINSCYINQDQASVIQLITSLVDEYEGQYKTVHTKALDTVSS